MPCIKKEFVNSSGGITRVEKEYTKRSEKFCIWDLNQSGSGTGKDFTRSDLQSLAILIREILED